MADVLSSNVDKKAVDGEIPVRLCNYVDVYYHDKITDQINFMAATATPSEIERFSLRAGNVVITKDSESADDIGVPALITDQAGDIVCGYHLAIFRGDTKHVHGPYLFYAIKSEPSARQFEVSANGVTRFGLPYGALKSLALPLPPIDEQIAIADFLDNKTAEIDDLIAKKEELLRLLAEQRTALITHAVTKGLNPNAQMKPSGIDWLGDVPEGWKVKPLKFLGRFQNGISIGGDSFGSGFPFVSYGDVYKNLSLPETGSGLVESTAKDRVLYSVERGDIFFTRTSETIEEIAISSVCETTIPDAVFAGFLIRCRPYPKQLDVGFSKYYFRNSRLRDYFVKEMNLVTRASLGQTLLCRRLMSKTALPCSWMRNSETLQGLKLTPGNPSAS
jgi:type I restriction enzyme S subunit